VIGPYYARGVRCYVLPFTQTGPQNRPRHSLFALLRSSTQIVRGSAARMVPTMAEATRKRSEGAAALAARFERARNKG
jgi:hypothetical protein